MMKKILVVLLMGIICLTGCSEGTSTNCDKKKVDAPSEKYKIGDEIELCGKGFNVYKIDDEKNELYLMAQNNIASTTFSDSERSYKEVHDYEGSLVERYVDEFVNDLESEGVEIKSSGIIDKDDLYALGFEDSDGLSGLPYRADTAEEFVKNEDKYWVGGYCKYESRAWAYYLGTLDTQPCDDEYGVRPIVVLDAEELE